MGILSKCVTGQSLRTTTCLVECKIFIAFLDEIGSYQTAHKLKYSLSNLVKKETDRHREESAATPFSFLAMLKADMTGFISLLLLATWESSQWLLGRILCYIQQKETAL